MSLQVINLKIIMKINSLAVFCGSKNGINPLFETQARELGLLLGSKKITLIYGGGNKGIMGAVSNAVLEKKGKVVGIIPELLKEGNTNIMVLPN